MRHSIYGDEPSLIYGDEPAEKVKSLFSKGWFKLVIGLLIVFWIASMTGCFGTTVRPGFVGVRTINQALPGFTAGVQQDELGVGWHPPVPMSSVEMFPTTIRTEVWADTEQVNENRNTHRIGPLISFANEDRIRIGLPVAIQISTNRTHASDLVQQYRFGFEEIINGPVQRELQSVFNRVGPHYTTNELLQDGGTALIAEVKAELTPVLARMGLILNDVTVVGPPEIPESVMTQITQLQAAEQETRTEIQRALRAEAQARTAVAQARGRAAALEIEGRALRANPGVARLREIERWNGQCPLDANVCAPGASALVQEHE